MSEMIERVARAIESGLELHTAQHIARMAIEAMREPSIEMEEAGQRNMPEPDLIWRAMIDAALR